MIDLHVENNAPDSDAIAIDIADTQHPLNPAFTVTVSRDAEGVVHICVSDHHAREDVWYVLGETGCTRENRRI